MSKTITLSISGIECPNCIMTLESLEDRLPGVLRAEGSYHKAQMKVEYDEAKVNEDQIKAAIQRLGYAVTGVA